MMPKAHARLEKRRINEPVQETQAVIATCVAGLLLMMSSGPAPMAEAQSRPIYEPLPARAIGILVPGNEVALAAEGRSGPTDAVLFSRNGKSYRWLYLPAMNGEAGEAVAVPAHAGGERRFADVLLASEGALVRRGVPAGYTVVEVEVNGGEGSPPSDRFIATDLRVLDGSAEAPFRADPLVREALQRCRTLAAETGAEQTFETLRNTTVAEDVRIVRQDRIVPRVTWLTSKGEVSVDCRIDLIGQESRHSAGASSRTPGPPQESTAALHGKRLSVSLEVEYRISSSGKIVEQGRSAPKTAVTETPPRGGASPIRP